jgi:hypothetical protein
MLIWDAPDTDLAGYLANLNAGYRISGQIFHSKFRELRKMK